MTNRGKQRLELHKHAVVAEIYPFTSNLIVEQPNPTYSSPSETSSPHIARYVSNQPSISSVFHIEPTSKRPVKAKLRLKRKRTKERSLTKINSTAVQQTTIHDAEIQTEPNLPHIPEDRTLPNDLQKLADRATVLSPSEKAQLETILREHHDIFAKDNDSFGKCPWVKFEIHTGTAQPVRRTARPIPLHYRKAVKETIMKLLAWGAIVPGRLDFGRNDNS